MKVIYFPLSFQALLPVYYPFILVEAIAARTIGAWFPASLFPFEEGYAQKPA